MKSCPFPLLPGISQLRFGVREVRLRKKHKLPRRTDGSRHLVEVGKEKKMRTELLYEQTGEESNLTDIVRRTTTIMHFFNNELISHTEG